MFGPPGDNSGLLISFFLFPSIRALSQQTGVDVPTGRQTEPNGQQRRRQERPGNAVAGDRRGRLGAVGENHDVSAGRPCGHVRRQQGVTGVGHHTILAV